MSCKNECPCGTKPPTEGCAEMFREPMALVYLLVGFLICGMFYGVYLIVDALSTINITPGQ